jgi:Raf kinase inhibitor-like YbhB/YbcL family protein
MDLQGGVPMKKVKCFKMFVMALVLAWFGAQPAVAGGKFTLSSPQVHSGSRIAMQQVFNGFGCTGQNVSPELHWSGVPAGTKSLALTVYDPDAPTGSGWWHWVVFNMDPKSTGLPANAGDENAKLVPEGSIQSRTDFGRTGYGGPCPPAGDKPHHYVFTLFALDVAQLPLDENAPAAMVGFYLHQHTIGKARLTGIFGRK